jgi:hypothetical protein
MFRKVIPYEVVADEIIQKLLSPLDSSFPDMVKTTVQALNGGRTPERAGQALLEALKDQVEKVRAVESEKQIALLRTIRELEQKVQQYQQERKLKQIDIEKSNKIINENQKIIFEQQTTISTQNRLLVEQHEQIVNLCGLQGDDTHQ